MIGLLSFALAVLASPFKSKLRLEAENAVLRHQLIVLRRRVRGRAQPTNNDRWFLVRMVSIDPEGAMPLKLRIRLAASKIVLGNISIILISRHGPNRTGLAGLD